MDVVYILGNGSRWQDNELRYSLRSLDKYASGIDNVLVCGHLPEWLRNVQHLPCADPYPLKADNAWHKIATVCRHMGKPFLLMNDDFFLLRETDIETIPVYYNGSYKDFFAQHTRESNYVQCHRNTYLVLQQQKLPTRNYAVHAPMPIDAQQFLQLHTVYGPASGLSYRGMYGNTFCHAGHTEIEDCKIHTYPTGGAAAADAMIANRPFMSIGDRFLTPDGKKYLHSLYPVKSSYEH